MHQPLVLNPRWTFVRRPATGSTPLLILDMNTTWVDNAVEASLRASIRSLELSSETAPVDVKMELDHLQLYFSADNATALFENFTRFFVAFSGTVPPDDVAEELPLTAPEQIQHHFLQALLQHTPYAERIEPLATRGWLDLPVHQLLTAVPLQLIFEAPDAISTGEVLEQLRTVTHAPSAFTSPPSDPPSVAIPSSLAIHAFETPMMGIWFDLGLQLPGQSTQRIHGRLLCALIEHMAREELPEDLLLLSVEYRVYRPLSYVHIRFFSSRPQQVLELQAHILDFLTYIKHNSLTQTRFRHLTTLLQQEIKQQNQQALHPLLFSHWKQFCTRYLSSDYLCWHQSFSQADLSPRLSTLRDKLPLLGYAAHPEQSLTFESCWQETLTEGLPGRHVEFIPAEDALKLSLIFESGTLFESHGGTCLWLMETLSDYFEQMQYQVRIGHNECQLELMVSSNQLTRCLKQIRQLFEAPLAPVLSLRNTLAIQQYEAGFKPQKAARAAFLSAAFPNHPYSRPLKGTYHSLQLVQVHHVVTLWERFKQGGVILRFEGRVPVALRPEHVQPLFDGLPEYQQVPLSLPPVTPRKGKIQAELPPFYSGMGRGFAVPDLATQLNLHQIDTALQQAFQGLPVHHELLIFDEAWALVFTGYNVAEHLQSTLEPLYDRWQQTPSASSLAETFVAYYLTGADWIHVAAHRHAHYV